MDTTRDITQVFAAMPTVEGAGVRLHRLFGWHEVPQFDPFLLLDDFSSSDETDYIAGFPWHPHRGIETVTYILDGEVHHKDSMGNEGSIVRGGVQWMTAGSGIIHEEMPQRHKEGIRGFQLWVNLPHAHKMMHPRYQDIKGANIPLVEERGVSVRIIAGSYKEIRGPVTDLMVQPVYLDVTLGEGKEFSYHVPSKDTACVYVFDGSVSIGESGMTVTKGHIALITHGERVLCVAKHTARFLLIAGKPLGEPVAWHGPIVMNTREELARAFEEYEQGTFVKTSAETL